MRFKQFIACGFFFAVFIVMALADNPGSPKLSGVPAAVQKTIHVQIGDGTLGELDRTNDGEEITFDVNYTTKTGDEHDFTVADDGTLLSIEVTQAEAPAAVQQTIRAEVEGWNLESIDQNVDDPDISYDVAASKDGRERIFTVAADGALLSLKINLTNAPAAVQTAIKAQVNDDSLESVCENFDSDGNSFDVMVATKNGVKKSFNVGMDGTMLSRQMKLDEVRPGARNTITEKIGDGKILRIDKSLSEKKAGVLPYEVQGRKDGKPFDFSVGPRGKFLGMDD